MEAKEGFGSRPFARASVSVSSLPQLAPNSPGVAMVIGA